MAKPKRESKPYEMERFGILNPYGDVWTPETFDTVEDAEKHIREFWGDRTTNRFKVVPVHVTVTARF